MAYKFSFSYSKWTLYNKCPQAFKFQNIDKIDTGPTPKALLEGRKIHDDIGDWIQGKFDDMPPRLKAFKTLATGMRERYKKVPTEEVIVEEQMAFDADKRRVKWFGKNARYRFIWDAAVHYPEKNEVVAVDWKTGKPYGSYDDQMEIFSVPAFWQFPQVTKFTGYLAYLDHDKMSEPYVYERPQFEEKVWPKWRTNISLFESDTTFAPTPSRDSCRFCDFHKEKGGPCQNGY